MQNKLVFNSLTILDSNLYGGVNYKVDVNPSTDLDVGTTAASEVTFTTDAINQSYIGAEFDYYVKQANDNDFRLINHFIISEVTKNNDGRYNITAYDNISKFDIDIADKINSSDYSWKRYTISSTSGTVSLNMSTFSYASSYTVDSNGAFQLVNPTNVTPTKGTWVKKNYTISDGITVSKSYTVTSTSSNWVAWASNSIGLDSSGNIAGHGSVADSTTWLRYNMSDTFPVNKYTNKIMSVGNNTTKDVWKVEGELQLDTSVRNKWTFTNCLRRVTADDSSATYYDSYDASVIPTSPATGEAMGQMSAPSFNSTTLIGKYFMVPNDPHLYYATNYTTNSSSTQTYNLSSVTTYSISSPTIIYSETNDYPSDGQQGNYWYKSLGKLGFPCTLGDLFKNICTMCSVDAYTTTFTNSTLTISENPFGGNVIIARTILGYIAAVAGAFIAAAKTGQIYVGAFSSASAYTFTNDKYVKVEYMDYMAPSIDKVQVSMGDSDIGIIVPASPASDSCLQIPYNPIFYNGSTATMTQYVTNIYNKVHAYSYRPMVIHLLQDFNINIGSKVLVKDREGNNVGYTYIFSKEWTASGVTLKSTGNAIRSLVEENNNSEIQALVGKYNTLKRTVDETVNEVGDLQTGLSTTVRIAADGVTITDQDGNRVVITGTCVDASTINAAQLNASQINTANLNLTGIISWNDLDNNTQARINASGDIYRQANPPSNPNVGAFWYCTLSSGSYAAGNWYTWDGTAWQLSTSPYYIKSTYIDATTIKSPTIEGNTVIVNSDGGGAFDVRKNGTSKGFLGVGSAYDEATGQLTEGVVVANNSDGTGTYLDDGDNYVSITPAETCIAFGYGNGQYRKIYLNSTGGYYDDGNGGIEELGHAYARFA